MTTTSASGARPKLSYLSDAGWLVSFVDDSQPQFNVSESHSPSLAVRAGTRDCTVAFFGTLYNGDELSKTSSDASKTETDAAELILQIYLDRGEQVLSRLRGVFALFIWDERRRVLLCVRDPAGIHPLFYARVGSKLLVSASIEALIHHPGVSSAVNRPALVECLGHRISNAEETFYESVNRILPGHALRVSSGHHHIFRYWDPAPEGKVNWIREGELELFNECLDKAVERCTDQGRQAIFLSGGFDSVSIAAIATARNRDKGAPDPMALSLIFPDPSCDEVAVQKGVADALGIEQTFVRLEEAVGPKGLLRSALELSSSLSTPLLNVYLPAYYQLALEGRGRGCEIILTGGGGDEWLTVSPYYAADLLQRFDLVGLYKLWKNMHTSYPLSKLLTLRNLLWRYGGRAIIGSTGRRLLQRFAPPLLRARRRMSLSIPDWLAPDPALRREIERRAMQDLADIEQGSIYVIEMRRALDHLLTSWELEESFEISRRLGAMMLLPYWDADLVELLYCIPPELLNQGGRSKGLVRQSVARRFPELGFEKHKKVLATNFFSSICVNEGAQIWPEMKEMRTLAKLAIVDPVKLDSTIRAILAQNDHRQIYRVWEILNLEAWCRTRY